jgi:hypothetical protein
MQGANLFHSLWERLGDIWVFPCFSQWWFSHGEYVCNMRFAKICCREMFLFYSIFWTTVPQQGYRERAPMYHKHNTRISRKIHFICKFSGPTGSFIRLQMMGVLRQACCKHHARFAIKHAITTARYLHVDLYLRFKNGSWNRCRIIRRGKNAFKCTSNA